MKISNSVKKALTKLSNGEKLNHQTREATIESALNAGFMFWCPIRGYQLTDAGKAVIS